MGKIFRKIVLSLLIIAACCLPATPLPSLAATKPTLLWNANCYILMQHGNRAITATEYMSDKAKFKLIDLDTGNAIPGDNELVSSLNKNHRTWLYHQVEAKVIFSDKTTVCYDLETGKRLWENADNPKIGTVKALDGDLVYIPNPKYVDTNISEIVCFKLSTGEIVFRKSVKLPFEAQGNGGYTAEIVKHHNKKLVFRYGGICYCYDLLADKFIWQSNLFNEYYSLDTVFPAIQNYFMGVRHYSQHCDHDYRIFCLDIETGEELWSLPGSLTFSVKGSNLYYCNVSRLDSCDQERYIGVIDITSGKLINRYPLGNNERITESMFNQDYFLTSSFVTNDDKSTTCILKFIDLNLKEAARIVSKIDHPREGYYFTVSEHYCFVHIPNGYRISCFSIPNYISQTQSKPVSALWLIRYLIGKIFGLP